MDSEQDIIELFQNGTQPKEAKERKRYRNRLAQRTYRLNQKAKLRALEEAVERSSEEKASSTIADEVSHALQPADYNQSDDQMWSLDLSRQSLPSTEPPMNPGHTPLHRAIFNGNESIVRCLIERGADIDKLDGLGNTALHLAVESGLEPIVRILLEEGMNPNETDLLGRTALFRAVQCENEIVAKLLLNSSADVNMRDATGNVALHMAVDCGSETLILLLLDHGADIDA